MIAPPALIAYASALAGHPVDVACVRNQSMASSEGSYVAGYTQYSLADDGTPVFTQTITLPAATCNRIVAILTPPVATRVSASPRIGTIVSPGPVATVTAVDPAGDGDALETLLHEAMHLRENSIDEALVERDTCRNFWQAVWPLKLPAWRAKATLVGMMDSHLTTIRSPVDYLALGC